MIETLAEMPAVARLTLKSSILKADRANRLVRRTGGLVACFGLLLLGPNARAGFGEELLSYMGIQVVEYGIDQILTSVNDTTHSQGSATLLSILGANTTGAQLNNISSQITAAQDMIGNLQVNLDNFEGNVNSDFLAVMQGQDQATYDTAMAPVVASLTDLSGLIQSYTNVIFNCYTQVGTNWVIKSQLTESDTYVLTNFANSYALQTTPDVVLQLLQTASTALSGSKCVYDTDLTLLQGQVPFQHQTYAGMYDLLNYIDSLRVTALYFKKEYEAYQLTQRPDTNISFSQWMTDNVVPDINAAASWINADVANNAVLTQMATLLTNTVATNAAQRLAYLWGLINITQTFYAPIVYSTSQGVATNPVYKVVSNADGRNYLIIKQTATLDLDWTAGCAPSYYTSTEDGRYQLAYDVGDIKGLLQDDPANNPLAYLIGPGGLNNITQADGILLGRTATNSSGSLYLLDAQAYSAMGDPDQYLRTGGTTNGPLVTGQNVLNSILFHFSDGTKPLGGAMFLSIYCDSHIAGVSTNALGYYTPDDAGQLPNVFSLNDGDVLDLSGLSGPLNKTVGICGNATLLGGGLGMALSGLAIVTYGGNLTVSNLYLSSSAEVINNLTGPLTVVALGSNCLQSSVVGTEDAFDGILRGAVLSSSGQYLTFTGPGSLEITNTSVGHAIASEDPVLVCGATNLVLGSQGTNSLYAGGIYIANSKVTSRVAVESDKEFVGGAVTLQNCSLDMSYGTINPTIIGHCTWLGAIRSEASFTYQSSYPGLEGNMPDAVYLKLVGTTGITSFKNINTLDVYGYYTFELSGTSTFSMFYSIARTGSGDFQGLGKLLSIEMYKQNDTWHTWEFESADIAPNVRGDVPSTYYVAGNNYWFNTRATNSFNAVEQNNPYSYTVNADNVSVTITGYSGPGGAVSLPATLHGLTVTGIGIGAFAAGESVTSVTIPATVSNIGDQAFANCDSLTNVYFEGGVPSLGGSIVFLGDPATVYYLPGPNSPVTGSWGAVLGGCATAPWVPFTYTTNQDHTTLTITGYSGPGGAVVIPSSINGHPVTGIADWTFNMVGNVYSATLPNSITNMGSQTFRDCSSLVEIYFQGNAPVVTVASGSWFVNSSIATVYYLPETTGWGPTFNDCPTALWLPFTYTVNPNNTVASTGYTGLGWTVTIPGTINGLPVTSLGGNAFYKCGVLSAVVIPGSVTNLEAEAFQMCAGLTGVYLQGNAPGLGGPNVFSGDSSATIYCLSGNTNGLTTVPGTFGGRPTALWLTVIGGSDGGVYTNLQQVAITANAPLGAWGFDQWTGATQYVASVTSSNTTMCLPAQPVTLTATYYEAPLITTQPANQTVIHGSNATFSVAVLGTHPLAYQWYFNGTNLSGETTSRHSLLGVTLADAGDYLVVVTNLYGSVTSSLARLTHISLPPGYNQMGGLLLSAGDMRLSFVGIPGWRYALDRSFSLSPVEWVPQATNPAGDGGALLFTNTPDPTTNNFWRIRLVR
jgi:BspA type Leucine rich repeat region (6 copies)/Immunoglobulin I-set domain/Divergent InlB B-repeat domain